MNFKKNQRTEFFLHRLSIIIVLNMYLLGCDKANNNKNSSAVIQAEKDQKGDGGVATFLLSTIPITINTPKSNGLSNYPFHFGIPFKESSLPANQNFVALIRMEDGSQYFADVEITSTYHWIDNSPRWLLIHANLPLTASNSEPLATPANLEIYSSMRDTILSGQELVVEDSLTQIEVNTGQVKFTVSKTRGTILDTITFDKNNDENFSQDEEIYRAPKTFSRTDLKRTGAYWVGRHKTNQSNEIYSSVISTPTVSIEAQGERFVIIREEGSFVRFGTREKSGRYIIRLTAMAGSPNIEINHTWINTEDTNKLWPLPNTTDFEACDATETNNLVNAIVSSASSCVSSSFAGCHEKDEITKCVTSDVAKSKIDSAGINFKEYMTKYLDNSDYYQTFFSNCAYNALATSNDKCIVDPEEIGSQCWASLESIFSSYSDGHKTKYSDDYRANCFDEATPTFALKELALGIPLNPSTTSFGYNRSDGSNTEVSSFGKISKRYVQVDTSHIFNGTNIQDGQLSGAFWAVSDGLTTSVGLEDFWQRFPKGFEFYNNAFRTLLWAPSNERRHNPDSPTAENFYKLWFVNEGNADFELTFQPPFEYSKIHETYLKDLYLISEYPNARGIGASHNILLSFGGSAIDTVSAFVANPQPVIVATNANTYTETNVFGRLSPKATSTISSAETLMDDITKTNKSLPDAINAESADYGWMTFGTNHSYHGITTASYDPSMFGFWGLDRIHPGWHHQIGRASWIQFARSRDIDALKWARQKTRLLMDVGVTHYGYTDPETGEELPLTDIINSYESVLQKCTGGLTDYKGIFPWHRGCRVADYNLSVEPLLWDFYLTGNRRALDVFREIIGITIEAANRDMPHGRSADATLQSFLYAYESLNSDTDAEERTEIKELISELIAVHLPWNTNKTSNTFLYSEPNAAINGWEAGSFECNWADWWTHSLTLLDQGAQIGDDPSTLRETIIDAIIDFADAYIEKRLGFDFCKPNSFNLLAEAYYRSTKSDKTKYLFAGLNSIHSDLLGPLAESNQELFGEMYDYHLSNWFRTMAIQDYFPSLWNELSTKTAWVDFMEKIYSSYAIKSASTFDWAFLLDRLPMLIAAIDHANEGVVKERARVNLSNIENGPTIPSRFAPISDKLKLRAYIKVENNEDAKINLRCYTGSGSEKPIVTLYGPDDPDNKTRLTWPAVDCDYSWNMGSIDYDLEESGEYMLLVTYDGSATCYLPVSSASYEVVATTMDCDDNDSIKFPQGQFVFSYNGNPSLTVTAPGVNTYWLISPSGETIQRDSMLSYSDDNISNAIYNTNGTFNASTTENGLWKLVLGGNDSTYTVGFNGGPQYFSLTSKRNFIPSVNWYNPNTCVQTTFSPR